MKVFIWLYFLEMFILFSCNNVGWHTPQSKKECIAVFKNECLTSTEFQSIAMSFNKKDSSRLAKLYIDQWKANQYLYLEALNSIIVDEDKLNSYLKTMKQQYYISEYIKKYIEDNLDTSVSNKEIIDFYQTHKDLFKLSNNIIQLFYVKLNDNEKDVSEFKKALLLANKNTQKIKSILVEKASSYFTEDSLWLKWDDVTKEIGFLKNYDIQKIPKGKVIEWRDGTYYYYIKIKDYKIKNEYSPIIYEKEKIKKIIMDDRKNKLIQTLYQQSVSMQSR